ncbi:MAG: Rpn family recombination-promoting nuclease/putative transposase [Bacteroidota bacterium]
MEQRPEKYINPLTDFGFKKLFGTEPNKDLLIDFLNQILPDQKIKDLTYTTNEQLGKLKVDRKAVFDLYCIGKDGERFIVEMQKAKQNYFKDRTVFYSSFPIQAQAQQGGDWDYKLKPVYSVGVLDFSFDDHKEEEELLHVVELKNQRCEVFYDKLKFVYIELPKFTKEAQELETDFDRWLYVFTHLQKLQDRPEQLQSRIFKKLFRAAEIAGFTKKEQEEYEESLKNYRDIKNVVDTARAEGVKIGEVKGEAKGEIKGARRRNIEIAKQMKEDGEPIQKIQKYTGLSKEEIEKL